MMKIKQTVLVACTNKNGEADLPNFTVEVNQDQYDTGHHYDIAIAMAEDAGYEKPFVCFDAHEQAHIARQVSLITCEIPFALTDILTGKPKIKGSLELGGSLCVRLEGHSDSSSHDDEGIILALTADFDDSARVRVWSEINKPEATFETLFDGARNEQRREAG